MSLRPTAPTASWWRRRKRIEPPPERRKHDEKRVVSFLLTAILIGGLAPTASAASDKALNAANELYAAGLFNGTGTHADGTPNYDLDRAPTRQEAVTMLVRLLGKEEAKNGTWKIMTTDFDVESNRFFSNDQIDYYANIKATKGMIVVSDKLSRSSSGKEALAEYLDDMESIFAEKMTIDAEMFSDSELSVGKTFLSISGNEYAAYINPLDEEVGDTNAWINFIAYVFNKEVARAVYGICSEKMILAAPSGYSSKMSNDLVEKYGATLVSDKQDSNFTHVATISVAGYNVKIQYEHESTPVASSDLYNVYRVYIPF